MNDILISHRKKILLLSNNESLKEFWWCMDDSLKIISSLLDHDRYCVISDFLTLNECDKVYDEVLLAYQQGLINTPGAIAGGRKGDTSLKVEDENFRNDHLGYFDGNEDNWPKGGGLARALDKINTIVYELRDCKNGNNELENVRSRSRAMITCYAGNGAKYQRHVDNPIKNGRKLSALLYLNKEWHSINDGGCLRLYEPQYSNNSNNYIDIIPDFNTLVLFWSDNRCPHEVMPCYNRRFAVTCWFIDSNEKMEADEIERQQKLEKQQKNENNNNDNNNKDTNVFELD